MESICHSSNINEQKEILPNYKMITPRMHNSLLNKRINNTSNINLSNQFITNNSSIPKIINRNMSFKSENMSLNNIPSFNPLIQNNFEKIPIIKNNFRKIKKIKFQNSEKYSNENLFKNRKSKHMKFASRNNSEFNKNNMKIGNNLNCLENDILNNKKNILTSKKYNEINHHFLTPIKRRVNSNSFESSKNCSINNLKINHYFALPKKIDKNPGFFSPRLNSAFFLPKLNPLNSGKNSSYLLDLEKEKILINQNLKKLLFRLKKKMMPEKKVVLSSPKLPTLKKINKNENKNSCIHRLEYGDSIVLVKTHLDGFDEEKKRKNNKKTKTNRKYEINEGYVDLNVLNSGNNISFKTNLIAKDGLYYYEFNKYGRMETVEEKVHKVKKDKKEFRKLLERYNKNESFKMMENQEFEANIKRNYGAKPVINKNIYRDLFHMLFKK